MGDNEMRRRAYRETSLLETNGRATGEKLREKPAFVLLHRIVARRTANEVVLRLLPVTRHLGK